MYVGIEMVVLGVCTPEALTAGTTDISTSIHTTRASSEGRGVGMVLLADEQSLVAQAFGFGL